ncbi:protein TEX261 [Octopus bimaculoides]|uniref:Protein TEX261 n=1 Tax=Octopus bimaculoides TaxID=37653 RepID=A0A0L8FNZ7_OCTBM|nr:protein TEX261 [Octopus bimaculoides]|eukprot:XP_014788127.1 PREDICTED: protein TEX261-like [Octopus bimaculoides]
MWFIYFLSWIGLLLQICFISLSVAAGLYYLAELVEEYTVFTARIIKYMIFATTTVYLCLLLFEEFPFMMILFGLVSCLTHFLLLKNFPYFVLSSPTFIASIVFIFINHYYAFSYFATIYYTFGEVLGYFTICLWFVPFAFFVSLSANEFVLPTVLENRPLNTRDDKDMDVVSNYFNRRGKRYGLLSFFKYAQESILPQRVKKQF